MTENSPRFNVLMAFDGSVHAQAAAQLVQELFRPCSSEQGCQLTSMTVLPTQYFGGHEAMQAALDALESRLAQAGMPVTTILKTGNPPVALLSYAEESQTDLIVMGAQGLRATLGILLGGVAQQVVEYSNLPVLVVRSPYKGLRRMLMVHDGSVFSRRAVNYLAPVCASEHDLAGAVAQPRIHGSQAPLTQPLTTGERGAPARRRCSWLPPDIEITVLHVMQPVLSPDVAARAWTLGPEVLYPAPLSEVDMDAIEAEEQRIGALALNDGQQAFEAAGLLVKTRLTRGDPATEVIQYARDHEIDLIACGSRGLSAISGWLLGSVSRKLVHYAPCSVLIVK